MCCECMSVKHPCLCRQYALRLVSYISGNHYLVGGPLSPAACQLFLLYREILRYGIWMPSLSVPTLTHTDKCMYIYGKSVKRRPFLGSIESFLFICYSMKYMIFHSLTTQLAHTIQCDSIRFNSRTYSRRIMRVQTHTHSQTVFPSRCWHQHQLLFMS